MRRDRATLVARIGHKEINFLDKWDKLQDDIKNQWYLYIYIYTHTIIPTILKLTGDSANGLWYFNYACNHADITIVLIPTYYIFRVSQT